MSETFKKHSDTELEITQTNGNDKIVIIQSVDTTLALLTETDEKIVELTALREVLSTRYDAGVEKGLKTRYQIDEENRIALEQEKIRLQEEKDQETIEE